MQRPLASPFDFGRSSQEGGSSAMVLNLQHSATEVPSGQSRNLPSSLPGVAKVSFLLTSA